MGKIVIALFVLLVIAGCYKQIPKEAVVPVEVKIVGIDAATPSHDEADIMITTHIKKASYYFSPRTADMPYAFTLSIDGKELIEKLKGVEEVESNVVEERGKGIHYALKKRLRLKPGRYEITLKTEDGRFAKIRVELKGGRLYILRFEPVYGPSKYLRPKHFREGVIDYRVYFEEGKILRE
ncbi:MAG: hypothetical protein A2X87_00330 [Deltaproteobacteria bacterium GWC2_42_51]|nr:MAG: hypothetical protein A2056_05640 [Deltaproteobacteria bacterium GWA2_42_85]OGP37253.1 MAG: hypothetical protein A2X87_00330 [Deltaproteobacteria bacterium GWC2_42_51]OGP43849.1 MAG: hypothetical protein A2090_02975 [Deltaproteobacteria bacterium GWD2_42_10]OGP47844.1 MAG: hypothetical protein A2022_02955 [Deltaproteobacteria bacterium GWF2_42_12]OGQ28513.1 MAG: hypothetical protein A3D29_05115 [Deltaproteobacteria bacterium RIFCSPHIGHO2_02_FULL_42_44]OGQ38560.1 MAG: hypothetical protei